MCYLGGDYSVHLPMYISICLSSSLCILLDCKLQMGSEVKYSMNSINFYLVFFNLIGKRKAMMPECLSKNATIFNL